MVERFALGGGSVTENSHADTGLPPIHPTDGLAGLPLARHGGATHSHVIINATSLGMIGAPPLVIDLQPFPDDTVVFDMVYAPLETPLLAAARARGLRTIDGLAMLIGQAATAFELFYGAPAPRQHDAELRALLVA